MFTSTWLVIRIMQGYFLWIFSNYSFTRFSRPSTSASSTCLDFLFILLNFCSLLYFFQLTHLVLCVFLWSHTAFVTECSFICRFMAVQVSNKWIRSPSEIGKDGKVSLKIDFVCSFEGDILYSDCGHGQSVEYSNQIPHWIQKDLRKTVNKTSNSVTT